MNTGDIVKLISIDISKDEEENWVIDDNLKLGGEYNIVEIKGVWIKLDGYKYLHPMSKFKLLSISEEAKQHLKEYTDFLLKEGYCDTDVYSEPPTAIDQYLILVNKKK